MVGLVRGHSEGARRHVERVTIHAVGSDVRQQPRRRRPVRHSLVARALVPQHHGEKHAHPAPMEVGDHLPQAINASGHVPSHIVLIAIVDTDVGVRLPDQHAVDPSVAALQVIEITVHAVLACAGVVKVPVVNHHLRLNEARLCPLELWPIVLRAVVTDADPPLHAPVLHVRKPFLKICGSRRSGNL